MVTRTSATAPRLFAGMPARDRPWWRGIVWCGVGGDAPAAFRGWQRAWLAVPEATSFVAASCASGRFHPADGVAVDVVDGRLAVAAPGRAWRYVRDRAVRALGPCACGAAGAAFEVTA